MSANVAEQDGAIAPGLLVFNTSMEFVRAQPPLDKDDVAGLLQLGYKIPNSHGRLPVFASSQD